MQIVLTGSLGPISKPLAIQLLAKGHTVTIVSSQIDREKDISTLGAKAAIGSIDDVDFLTTTFIGADVVYLMEPTANMFDPTIDLLKCYEKICMKYVHAILNSQVKRIVHLSSIGGHSSSGNGLLTFHYYAEQALSKLPTDVTITTLRPVSFYSNIMAFLPTIKENNAIITSYHASEAEPWASPLDIADAAAEEFTAQATGRKVRYIISDFVTSERLVKVLGEAIGKELQWVTVSHQTLENAYINYGMSPQAANGFAKLNEAKNSGLLYEDLAKHKREITLGKIKIEDFAKEFSQAYKNS